MPKVRHFWCLDSKDTRMTIEKQMITYVYIFILPTVIELWLTNFWKCPGRPKTKPRLYNKQTWGRDSQLCWICLHRQICINTFPLFKSDRLGDTYISECQKDTCFLGTAESFFLSSVQLWWAGKSHPLLLWAPLIKVTLNFVSFQAWCDNERMHMLKILK